MVMVSGPNSVVKFDFSVKGLSFRRQRILRPLLVSIFQDEADGDGFGSKFLLKIRIWSKGLYFRCQRILRAPLVLIFQGEADGDGFGAECIMKQ